MEDRKCYDDRRSYKKTDGRKSRVHPYSRPDLRQNRQRTECPTFDLAIRDLRELMQCHTAAVFRRTNSRAIYNQHRLPKPGCRFFNYNFKRSVQDAEMCETRQSIHSKSAVETSSIAETDCTSSTNASESYLSLESEQGSMSAAVIHKTQNASAGIELHDKVDLTVSGASLQGTLSDNGMAALTQDYETETEARNHCLSTLLDSDVVSSFSDFDSVSDFDQNLVDSHTLEDVILTTEDHAASIGGIVNHVPSENVDVLGDVEFSTNDITEFMPIQTQGPHLNLERNDSCVPHNAHMAVSTVSSDLMRLACNDQLANSVSTLGFAHMPKCDMENSYDSSPEKVLNMTTDQYSILACDSHPSDCEITEGTLSQPTTLTAQPAHSQLNVPQACVDAEHCNYPGSPLSLSSSVNTDLKKRECQSSNDVTLPAVPSDCSSPDYLTYSERHHDSEFMPVVDNVNGRDRMGEQKTQLSILKQLVSKVQDLQAQISQNAKSASLLKAIKYLKDRSKNFTTLCTTKGKIISSVLSASNLRREKHGTPVQLKESYHGTNSVTRTQPNLSRLRMKDAQPLPHHEDGRLKLMTQQKEQGREQRYKGHRQREPSMGIEKYLHSHHKERHSQPETVTQDPTHLEIHALKPLLVRDVHSILESLLSILIRGEGSKNNLAVPEYAVDSDSGYRLAEYTIDSSRHPRYLKLRKYKHKKRKKKSYESLHFAGLNNNPSSALITQNQPLDIISKEQTQALSADTSYMLFSCKNNQLTFEPLEIKEKSQVMTCGSSVTCNELSDKMSHVTVEPDSLVTINRGIMLEPTQMINRNCSQSWSDKVYLRGSSVLTSRKMLDGPTEEASRRCCQSRHVMTSHETSSEPLKATDNSQLLQSERSMDTLYEPASVTEHKLVQSLEETTTSKTPLAPLSEKTTSKTPLAPLSEKITSKIPLAPLSEKTTSKILLAPLSKKTTSKIPLAPLSETTTSKIPLAPLSETTTSKIPLAPLSETTTSKIPLAPLSENTATKFQEVSDDVASSAIPCVLSQGVTSEDLPEHLETTMSNIVNSHEITISKRTDRNVEISVCLNNSMVGLVPYCELYLKVNSQHELNNRDSTNQGHTKHTECHEFQDTPLKDISDQATSNVLSKIDQLKIFTHFPQSDFSYGQLTSQKLSGLQIDDLKLSTDGVSCESLMNSSTNDTVNVAKMLAAGEHNVNEFQKEQTFRSLNVERTHSNSSNLGTCCQEQRVSIPGEVIGAELSRIRKQMEPTVRNEMSQKMNTSLHEPCRKCTFSSVKHLCSKCISHFRNQNQKVYSKHSNGPKSHEFYEGVCSLSETLALSGHALRSHRRNQPHTNIPTYVSETTHFQPTLGYTSFNVATSEQSVADCLKPREDELFEDLQHPAAHQSQQQPVIMRCCLNTSKLHSPACSAQLASYKPRLQQLTQTDVGVSPLYDCDSAYSHVQTEYLPDVSTVLDLPYNAMEVTDDCLHGGNSCPQHVKSIRSHLTNEEHMMKAEVLLGCLIKEICHDVRPSPQNVVSRQHYSEAENCNNDLSSLQKYSCYKSNIAGEYYHGGDCPPRTKKNARSYLTYRQHIRKATAFLDCPVEVTGHNASWSPFKVNKKRHSKPRKTRTGASGMLQPSSDEDHMTNNQSADGSLRKCKRAWAHSENKHFRKAKAPLNDPFEDTFHDLTWSPVKMDKKKHHQKKSKHASYSTLKSTHDTGIATNDRYNHSGNREPSPHTRKSIRSRSAYKHHLSKTRVLLDSPVDKSSHDPRWSRVKVHKKKHHHKKCEQDSCDTLKSIPDTDISTNYHYKHPGDCSLYARKNIRTCSAYRQHFRKAKALLDDPGEDTCHDLTWSPLEEGKKKHHPEKSQSGSWGILKSIPDTDMTTDDHHYPNSFHPVQENIQSDSAYREHLRKAKALLDFPTQQLGHDIRWAKLKEDQKEHYQKKSKHGSCGILKSIPDTDISTDGHDHPASCSLSPTHERA